MTITTVPTKPKAVEFKPLLDLIEMTQRVADLGTDRTTYHIVVDGTVFVSCEPRAGTIGTVEIEHPAVMIGTWAEIHGDFSREVESLMERDGLLVSNHAGTAFPSPKCYVKAGITEREHEAAIWDAA